MWIRIAAAFGAVSLATVVAPAAAHEEQALHALTVIDRVAPAVEGIDVRVVHLDAPAMVITNETDEVLTVLGARDEPFLQIGPGGVRANVESPTTYRSIAPRRELVPPGVKPSGPPRWAVFSEESTWTWFDPRLSFSRSVGSWEVTAELDGRPMTIEGSFEPLQGHGHFITEMDPPDVEGLELRLTQGAIPAVFARNETGEVLFVPGDADEPFLRIGPRGVVANLRSPTYYTSGGSSIAKVPEMADASAAPKWKKVSPHPVWAWLERRAALPAELYQRDRLGTDQRTVLEWTTEYRLGGEPLAVTGRVEWVPPVAASRTDVTSETRWGAVATTALAAIATGAFLFRRRRARR